MFGMSFSEILVIAIIAVLVLGPEKLPKAMVEIAKFFKMFKKSINDAKTSFDQEIKIAQLKQDALKYQEEISQTTENIRKKLTFEELDEIKKNLLQTKEAFDENFVKNTGSLHEEDAKQAENLILEGEKIHLEPEILEKINQDIKNEKEEKEEEAKNV